MSKKARLGIGLKTVQLTGEGEGILRDQQYPNPCLVFLPGLQNMGDPVDKDSCPRVVVTQPSLSLLLIQSNSE